ncbi:hypothetical protein [Ilyobacter polytropus]|uniref:Uncharacterized protein n=1 Tax=Ilyobacter polytropus (strain ATCC 51220 / DSM 2926 / LMG 16218 / CuHBu1) TaxID=572544 RepID=E3HBR3_ILYPC|nr:hypothetical protein [Ilyobacter polytropus]ADO83825.1 hypothetical protein Ilyop_2054 [Ilyobacter polytropus DSM 2926]
MNLNDCKNLEGDIMHINQIKRITEDYVSSLNSLDLPKIISLVHQDIGIYSMKNGDIVKLAFGIEEFKSIFNFFNIEYQFIYWKIINHNIKDEFTEVIVRQKIFFLEDIPDGPKAWDMNEQISKMVFKFKNEKIKNISILYSD